MNWGGEMQHNSSHSDSKIANINSNLQAKSPLPGLSDSYSFLGSVSLLTGSFEDFIPDVLKLHSGIFWCVCERERDRNGVGGGRRWVKAGKSLNKYIKIVRPVLTFLQKLFVFSVARRWLVAKCVGNTPGRCILCT